MTPILPVSPDNLGILARFLLENTTLIRFAHASSTFLHRAFRKYIYYGSYEVLEHEVTLELHDTKGQHATYLKRQKVRFLQDNVIAYQDQAWGDGNIFEEYKCSPGVPVDKYREAYRYRILISLRETKNYGDVQEFNIERKIRGGFVGDTQDFQTQVDQRTYKLSISVIFPRKRTPKELWLLERNSTKTFPLTPEQIITLPDGRVQAIWSSNKPRLFEAYTLRWKW